MTIPMFKSVVIELRPKLQSANVFVNLNEDCTSTAIVDLADSSCQVNLSDDKNFTIPFSNFKASPSTLSSLKISKQSIFFRFFTVGKDSGFKAEVLENKSLDSRIENLNLIKKDTEYVIECGNCSRNLLSSNIKFSRVLPLPETLPDSADWFCHSHNSDVKETCNLAPSINDLFFTSCFALLHKTSIQHSLCKNDVFACKFCLYWLGVSYKNDAVKLWFNTVRFVDRNRGVIQTTGLSDSILTVKKMFETSLLNSLKIMLQSKTCNGTSNYLLLWILEKQLKVIFIDHENSSEKEVAKTLFKFIEGESEELVRLWKGDHAVEIIEVSKLMIVEVLKHLYNNFQYFPPEFALSNDMFVSYLFINE